MRLHRAPILALTLLSVGVAFSQSPDEISVREHGRYRYAGSDWVILIVPPGTTGGKLVMAARNLHSVTPDLKYEFFDASGKELDKYLTYQQRGGRGDYSDSWVSKHNVANLQVMSLDAGVCANWCLIKDGLVFEKFERIKCPLDNRDSGTDSRLPIKTTYDRFTDKTTVVASTKVKGDGFHGLYLSISATFSGQTSQTRPTQLLLMISAVSSGIALAQDRQLLAVVDKERVDLGELKFIGSDRVDATATSTAYATMVPYLTVMRLSFARSVEMRFDGIEFTLPPDYQSKVRDMLRQFPD